MVDNNLYNALIGGLAGYNQGAQKRGQYYVDANYAGNGLARTGLGYIENKNYKEPFDMATMLTNIQGGGNGSNIDFGKYGSLLKGAFGKLGSKAVQLFGSSSGDGSAKLAIDEYVNGYPEGWGSSSVGQSIGEYMKGYSPYTDYSLPVSNAIEGYEPFLNKLGIYGGYQQ